MGMGSTCYFMTIPLWKRIWGKYLQELEQKNLSTL